MLPTRGIYREIYIIFPFSVVKLGIFHFLQIWIHLNHGCQAIRLNPKECVCPACEEGCDTSLGLFQSVNWQLESASWQHQVCVVDAKYIVLHA